MRVYLKINTNNEELPFNHQHLLTGAIYKWLGNNDEHGKVSLYSFSWLRNGKKTQTGLSFGNHTTFFFSSFDVGLIKRLVNGIKKDNTIYNGYLVNEIIIQEDPDLTDQKHFHIESPILIKRKNGQKIEHITFKDDDASLFMKETLQTKLEKAGIESEDFEIKFNPLIGKATTKLVRYKSIENRASWCPITINGSNKLKQFAWNVGIGNSTGIGFGAIK